MAQTTPLQEGQPAPDFRGVTTEGQDVSLADYRGQWLILYFYPKDDTPGCTKEACSFRDHYSTLTGTNAAVLGVSLDSAESHQKFTRKFGLPFNLLADTDATVSTAYGVYGEKSNYGKTYMGIIRTTFLIDPQGVIRTIFRKVDVDNHATELLAAIKEAGG